MKYKGLVLRIASRVGFRPYERASKKLQITILMNP